MRLLDRLQSLLYRNSFTCIVSFAFLRCMLAPSRMAPSDHAVARYSLVAITVFLHLVWMYSGSCPSGRCLTIDGRLPRSHAAIFIFAGTSSSCSCGACVCVAIAFDQLGPIVNLCLPGRTRSCGRGTSPGVYHAYGLLTSGPMIGMWYLGGISYLKYLWILGKSE